MKLTLLEMVQDILSSMDSDTVNSIADTEEALQVAQVIKTTYANMVVLKDLDCFRKTTQLMNVSDPTRPNYMRLPENTSKMTYLAVDQRKTQDASESIRFQETIYLYPDEFIRKCNGRGDDSNVIHVEDFSGVTLRIVNDRAPTYWTSFDDNHIVFDSYPRDFSTTLITSQTQAIIYELPTWSMDSNFVPKLPLEMYPGLLAEAKSVACYELRQSPNEKAEQASIKNQRLIAQRGWRAKGGIRYPSYGRNRTSF